MANTTTSLPSPGLQKAIETSTIVWLRDLQALFHHAKERFPDVVWEVRGGEDEDNGNERELWGHKAIIYSRATPSFQTEYFPAAHSSSSPTTSSLSLDIPHPPFRPSSPSTSAAPASTITLVRLGTSTNPFLISNELEYLYTGRSFGKVLEFLLDTTGPSDDDVDPEDIDKLRKDLVYMWRSRLFSDVRITLTGNFSSTNHENTTAIFSSHRFVLVSRSPYFHLAFLSSPAKQQDKDQPQTLELPSPPFTPASLHFTLGFIYTGTLNFSQRTYDLGTAFHIMRSATYLSIPSLYDEIQAHIIQKMMHGLFHAFLPFPEYERLIAGAWGTGGCRCRQCARRAPRVLEFSLLEGVKNGLLERGARRALVGLFGEGWCTSEFAALPTKLRESLLKGVSKRTTPKNALALLFAAEHALLKLASVADAWASDVIEIVLVGRKRVDELLCAQSEECFDSAGWGEIMERDGLAFEDAEKVNWIMAAVMRGVTEHNAALLYQTLVSSILLRPHSTEIDSSMLSSTSHIRVQVEQTRIDLLKWIGKRWLEIRQEGGFDELGGWALKEISDNIEVPPEDLLSPSIYTIPTSQSRLKQQDPPHRLTLLHAEDITSNDNTSMHSSMWASVSMFTSPKIPFRHFSSDCDNPVEWLIAKHEFLSARIISESGKSNHLEYAEWARSCKLFSYLAFLSCSTLMDLPDLKASLSAWRSWDAFTSLCRFREINDAFCSLFADRGIDQIAGLRDIVEVDIDEMCIRLYQIMNDAEQYRNFLNLRDDNAKSILDLLQALLDRPTLDRIFRAPFLNALLRLSKKSGLHPSSLLQQQQVSLEGNHAVAQGHFGDVWKGRYRDQEVAVKIIRMFLTSDINKEFKKILHEMLIWRQLRHPNVLPFLCLHQEQDNHTRIGLVSPWMENGNVRVFLHAAPSLHRVPLIIDIAEGLRYLHDMDPSIVHGDLKAVNILVTSNRQACLADFGLSTASGSHVLHLSSFSSGITGGTSRWMAPELLDGTREHGNKPSDVYAFACVCYEMVSGNVPFIGLNDNAVIFNVPKGRRPTRPTHCQPHDTPCQTIGLDDDLWNLIERCWAHDPEQRPSMGDVLDSLPPRPPSLREKTDSEPYHPVKERQMDLLNWFN